MTVPRTRRYPRRPIVKAQPKFSDRLRLRIEPSSAWVEGELALLKAIKRKLDEPVAGWTTNLAPTSPPLPPEDI